MKTKTSQKLLSRKYMQRNSKRKQTVIPGRFQFQCREILRRNVLGKVEKNSRVAQISNTTTNHSIENFRNSGDKIKQPRNSQFSFFKNIGMHRQVVLFSRNSGEHCSTEFKRGAYQGQRVSIKYRHPYGVYCLTFLLPLQSRSRQNSKNYNDFGSIDGFHVLHG